MIAVAIVKRRLREGKTYDDFRHAWYHGTGFGAANRMFTLLNVADPREIVVIGLTETSLEDAARLIAVDAAERAGTPLDAVVEPTIDRTFGILVAEDDFSARGPIPYREAAVGGRRTDGGAVNDALTEARELLKPYLRAQGE